MATALHMPHRPEMDRTPSFDRPRSTPPFATGYERTPSPSVLRHSRTNSNSSHHSPYQQPFPSQSYFPQSNQLYTNQPQAWSTTALPASSFYQTNSFQAYPNQPIFHPGFQQSHADFAAWANAYQHMVMASVANGGAHPGGMTPQPTQQEYQAEARRRTNSGPQQFVPNYLEQSQQSTYPQQPSNQTKLTAQSKPFHPYKRGPTHQSSRENMTRSTSQQSLSRIEQGSANPTPVSNSSSMPSIRPSFAQEHHRNASMTSTASSSSVAPQPRVGLNANGRRDSFTSDQDQSPKEEKVVRSIEAPLRASSPSTARSPLTPGPISNATNTPSTRSSPLSQAPMAPSPAPTEKMVKSGGLKGRLRRALDKDAKKEQKSAPSTPTKSIPLPSPQVQTTTSPSEASTRSSASSISPSAPSLDNLESPRPGFAVSNSQGMNSEISLAETERTATTSTPLETKEKEKGKKGLFRMKNMSTDNISLSSTVSSASMMIRKMGSLGKIARRNSLMGISKIFKDKPKDEDSALPEKESKKKKEKKSKTKKGEAPASEDSRAMTGNERLVSEEDDRILAGLSPAAKLARQHTLKSRAAANASRTTDKGTTGEPTWDTNTSNRPSQTLPSISSVSSAPNPGTQSPGTPGIPGTPGTSGIEVLHIRPRTSSVTAVAVEANEHEYDSENDSSDGETVEDLSTSLEGTRLDEDSMFRQEWSGAFIDRNAVPKKGILKTYPSYEELQPSEMNRNRSNSVQTSGSLPGPLLKLPKDGDQIDGLHHPSPRTPTKENYDPFSATSGLTPQFDLPSTTVYSNATLNVSLPALSVLQDRTPNHIPHQGVRAMTAPTRKRLVWAPECAVYSTYDAGTYDRRSEPATCNRLTPELAMAIKQELNAFKLEMPVHPSSQIHTHFFA